MEKHIDREDGEDDKPKTKFNAGLAKLERIDKLRKGCHDAKIIRDYSIWNGCLRGYRGELNAWMSKGKDGEREKADEAEKAIDSALNEKQENTTELFNLMCDYELWLADLEKDFGLSMPDKQDGIDAASG